MKSARLIYESTLEQISETIGYPLTREALLQAQNQWLQYPGLFDLTFPPISLFVRNYIQLRLLGMEKVSQSMLFSLEKALEKLPPSLGLLNVELWVERHLMTLKE